MSKESNLIAFSCLSGEGKKEAIDISLGSLFTLSNIRKMIAKLEGKPLFVILDDCEPVRVWQWIKSQTEVTEWCRLIIDDKKGEIPTGWEVILWSDIELRASVTFDQVLDDISLPQHALARHHLEKYMREFPNKKLIGKVGEAARRRLAQYALQGVVLEQLYPNATLLQTEKPAKVKDPLYQPLRQKPLPIIHPFSE